MKNLRLSLISFFVPVSWLLASAIAHAQAKVTIDPEDLTIAGSRNQVEARLIFVTPDQPIKNLRIGVSARSLYRTDRMAVFPTTAIVADNPQTNPKQPNEMIVPVEFNLQQAPSSGEFQGKLRLSYQHEEQELPVREEIPVTVKVKDDWFLPLIVLFIGTGLGISVSSYRAKGRPRDEILVREGELRSQMQSDSDLAKAEAFKNHIEAYLVDVKMALQGERWQEGEDGIQQAENIWRKWNKGRTSWLRQLDYARKLKERLQDLDPNLPYIQEVRRNLEEAREEAPTLESPLQLRENLEKIAQQINRYLQLQAKIKQLKNLVERLSNEATEAWQLKVSNWEQQIAKLLPSDLKKDTNLDREIEEAIAEITELISQQEGIARGLPKLGISIPLLESAPSARPLDWQTRVTKAGLRLRVFTWTSYAIAVVFLAGAGFIELYVEKDTFGANPWQDYFALLAWGFGAEASRDAIAKVVRDWGLPGLK